MPCALDDTAIIPNDIPVVGKVEGSTEIPDDKPPEAVLSALNPDQRVAFSRLWSKIPAHLRAIHLDFEENLWTTADIDSLGNLLNKYAHRFSKHSTNLGHVTLDPFPHYPEERCAAGEATTISTFPCVGCESSNGN